MSRVRMMRTIWTMKSGTFLIRMTWGMQGHETQKTHIQPAPRARRTVLQCSGNRGTVRGAQERYSALGQGRPASDRPAQALHGLRRRPCGVPDKEKIRAQAQVQ